MEGGGGVVRDLIIPFGGLQGDVQNIKISKYFAVSYDTFFLCSFFARCWPPGVGALCATTILPFFCCHALFFVCCGLSMGWTDRVPWGVDRPAPPTQHNHDDNIRQRNNAGARKAHFV